MKIKILYTLRKSLATLLIFNITPETKKSACLVSAYIMSAVVFQSCTASQPIQSCPLIPRALSEDNVKQIPMDEGRNFLLAGELSANELKGYTFTVNKPNPGRQYRLYMSHNPNICIWISDPANSTVPFNTPYLKNEGKHVVQIASLDKRITQYYLHGTLSDEKDSFSVSQEASGQLPESFLESRPFSQPYEQPHDASDPSSNPFETLISALATNILAALLLVLFGSFGITTSIGGLIRRYKENREIDQLWQTLLFGSIVTVFLWRKLKLGLREKSTISFSALILKEQKVMWRIILPK